MEWKLTYKMYNYCCKEWDDWCEAMEEMKGEDPEMYPFTYCPMCGLSFTLTSPSISNSKPEDTSKSN